MPKGEPTTQAEESWLDKSLRAVLNPRLEAAIFALILLAAVFTRFYQLGARPMSHDESLHTFYSWQLYKGNGYQHNPMMHGPLQFHLIALSFFLFGDNDFTARVPHALAAVLAIALLWLWRRYLGKKGMLIAAGLMLISPYMMYYGRYARNEALIMPLALLTLWATLRYLETGATRYLTWLTVASALHFVTKETAFIYTAQLLIFLAFLLIDHVSRQRWEKPAHRGAFFISLLASVGAVFLAGIAAAILRPASPPLGGTAAPAQPGQLAHTAGGMLSNPMIIILLAIAVLAAIAALYYLIVGYGWKNLLRERSFVLIILLFSLVLPQLAPLPMRFLHWDAMDYSATGIIHSAIFVIALIILAFALGWVWDFKTWLTQAAIFYGIFAVFQTTVFTNGQGFFSGLVAALGYWLQQQGVHRGSQPWYYYILIQVPIYEYLPALGATAAMVWVGWKRWLGKKAQPTEAPSPEPAESPPKAPVFALLAYWSVTALLAFTIAGEKMPWLTVHITLPMILLTGWFLGKLADAVDWRDFNKRNGWVLVGLVIVFILSAAEAVGSLMGTHRPFMGSQLSQLTDTANFIVGTVVALLSGWGITALSSKWSGRDLARIGTLTFFGVLALLTTHTAVQASFYNYDQANEYLVYAHSARGVKTVMSQVREISLRLHDDLGIQVAYDNAVAWPFTWYLRNYYNQKYYGDSPSADLRNVPIVIVGAANYAKVEPILRNDYIRYDYIRMVWPNQDYFNLTWSRIKNALSNPAMRAAIFRIWLNRDFTLYGKITGETTVTAANWEPSDRMRLYIRKDIAAKMWNYGVAPEALQSKEEDQFTKKEIHLKPDAIIGGKGVQPGQFQNPRGIAVAPDGSIFVADTGNHRIQHISPDGKVISVWGSFASLLKGEKAPPGTFDEPWDVAVGPDGDVYVADTWNSRIQKFTPDGKFITMWGSMGNGGDPLAMWGPRGIVVDPQGRVFVSDTGNKRIVVFDSNGKPLGRYGSGGAEVGQFSEPVGLALDVAGNLYVADTWNQRVQVFMVDAKNEFTPLRQWQIYGWFGQSLDNKPYLSVDKDGHVFVGDPEGYRVLEFDARGNLLAWWGEPGTPPQGLGIVGGIAADNHGGVWVTDASNGYLLHFTLEK